MEKNIVIIGAGIVGLGIASEVAKKGREVYVIEKHNSFGQETSSRNSEVIHAGIYYPKDSLKAKLCVEGNNLVYKLAEEHDLPHKRIGKIIIASDDSELEGLETTLKKGEENGVPLEFLTQEQVKKLQPGVKAVAGVYSPTTGIIDSHSFMKFYETNAVNNGSNMVYGHKVVGIDKTSDGYVVSVQDNDGEISKIEAGIIINSAGLGSDKIAEMSGIDINKEGYNLHFCKGDYFTINPSKSKKVSMLVYPAPKKNYAGLGVHLTLDLNGQARLGPDVEYLENNIERYDVDTSKQEDFFKSAKRFLPFLEYEDLNPGIGLSGIRSKLQAPGEPVKDFLIREESAKGLPGLINLIGIESPGLTASPAIAKYVGKIVDDILR